jgi:hypothetical protein
MTEGIQTCLSWPMINDLWFQAGTVMLPSALNWLKLELIALSLSVAILSNMSNGALGQIRTDNPPLTRRELYR